MKSLFNATDNQEIVARINKLTTTGAPEWGKFNVAQMTAHCGKGLQVAVGDVMLSRSFIGYLFGGIAKKKIINEQPFGRNSPTDKRLLSTEMPNFDAEKQKLIELVQRFAKGGPNGVTKNPHSFFGELTPQEWDTLMWKHLDHHLRQFGV